jgi:ABC-type phosphate transport system substrate-binding protein
MTQILGMATLRHLLIAGAALCAATAALAEPLVVQGSTTFNRRLLQPFQSEIEAMTGLELTVIPNKSASGIIALLEGRTRVIMLSAPLDAEVEHLRKALPGLPYDNLRTFEVDRTRVAVTIHKSNPVRSLTLYDITKILQGRITNWNVVGGPDLPIKVFLVGGGGGVTVAVQAALLDGQEARAPNKIYSQTPVQLVQMVEQEPGAIGFAQLALIKQREGKELKTDKPIEQVLYYVTSGEPTPAVMSLINATRIIAGRLM